MFDLQVDVEMQDAKSSQISKPVASRPSRGFRSVPELPTSSSASLAEKPIASKPKATRFRAASSDSAAIAFSLMDDDTSATEMTRTNILVKPTAKSVSRATASLLSSLGNTDSTQQPPVANDQFVEQELKQTLEASNSMRQSQELDARIQQPAGQDRQSYDGYNWRKYGQKQVKGSEYPRSYYKCTYPTCQVKKKVERSFDGQIAEIVYKGEHNHPKPQPQPPRRVAPGLQEQAFAAVAADENSRETGNLSWSSSLLEVNPKELSMAPNFCAQVQLPHHRLINSNYGGKTNQTDSSTIQVCTIPTSTGAMDNCMLRDCKRRKNEEPISGTNRVGETFTEPQSLIQTSAESNISGDGYHWRKYGQKVVKGNSYPRSYYKCTAPKCNVRKYTERASDNSNYIVTTYEGKHDHEMPMKRTNSVVTNTETPPS
ncbi:WRKY transcription factor 44-like isoform X1 [Zingiber officinale]|uniref:WRKY transcription factor 44-like isoform X1 n=1 Tax=Zingiber officinale TaxID=94328 RepID=UPI001C4D97BA|nr:WRKY transcription factor 44-like isoform X1 [Zingiber officinale]